MIRNALLKIMSEYPDAITQSRVGHPLSSFIEKDAVSIIKKKLPSKYLSKNYFVHGSSGISNRWAGQGNGKRNPFIMIGNPKDSPKILRLFSVSNSAVTIQYFKDWLMFSSGYFKKL